jgi:hypothetical protein
MKTSDKMKELDTKIEKIDGKVLFLLSITSIQFLLIIILYLKR